MKKQSRFEGELRAEANKIAKRYRELNADGKREMIALLESRVGEFEASESRNLLLSFRDSLLSIS